MGKRSGETKKVDRAYAAPRLSVFGSVVALTAAGLSGVAEAGSMAASKKS